MAGAVKGPRPSETPYLHVKETDGSLFPFAVAITGNAKALLQLRKQIYRALEGEEWYLLDDTTYWELDGEEYEVVMKRARQPGGDGGAPAQTVEDV